MSDGFSAVQELISPFNLKNYFAIATTLDPGIGAVMWANQLAAKHAKLPHCWASRKMLQLVLRQLVSCVVFIDFTHSPLNV
ncbi:MAG TPA: hypothetical protein VII35_15065 [Steroidobacteraceae bacterium]